MDVGFAVHRYSQSEGTGRYAVELVTRIAEVSAVTLYAARVEAPVPTTVKVVRVPAILAKAVGAILTFPLAFRAVRKRHDVLHAQGWVTGSADVVTAHIVLAAWRDAARRNGVVAPPGERLFGPFVQRRERTLYRSGARYVIAPSNKVRDELAAHYGRTTSVALIRHGFAKPAALSRVDARRQLSLPFGTFIALYVGDPRKGLDIAVRAVRDVPSVHLAMASHSSERATASYAHAASLGDRFHWLGSLSDPALAFGAADALIHPTIYDSFGLAIADAMSAGLPVITTRQAGVAELIEHGSSAWIVAGDAASGTAEALRALHQDPHLRRRLADGGRAVAASRSWDAVARETLEVYREVAAR